MSPFSQCDTLESHESQCCVQADQLAQLNLRILSPLALFVRENHGETCLEKLKKDSGLENKNIVGQSDWGSLEQVEAFLSGVRALVDSDEDFKVASAYKIKQSYGPMFFLLRATTPDILWKRIVKTMPAISSFSHYEVLEIEKNRSLTRYVSKRQESRLMCLSRQAQGAAFTTIWGLPPAHFNEKSCIANGDENCTYELIWYQHRRMIPPILGTLLGVIAAASAYYLGTLSYEAAIFASILGGSLALSWELRRTNRTNLKIGHEIDKVVRKLARDDAEARREILALTQRQEEWTRLMEQRVAERTAVIEGVSKRIRSLQNAQQVSLRGFSHDLRNPLTTLRMSTQYLKDILEPKSQGGPPDHEEIRNVIQEQEDAIIRMEQMLKELVELSDPDTRLIHFAPTQLEMEDICEQLRKRLKALVHGKDIRVSLIRTREAPEAVIIDSMLFNRIVDNLMTNAVKYTERGSIVVEMSGRPNRLTIKISDTGRGIEKDRLSRIFHPKSSRRAGDPKDGFGVGLSVVVQLLAQVGGKLEVMSLENKGTTFWVHLPLHIRERRMESMIPIMSFGEKRDQIIDDVVTVRPQTTAANIH